MSNLDKILETFADCGIYLEAKPSDDPDYPDEQYIDLAGGTRLYFNDLGELVDIG